MITEHFVHLARIKVGVVAAKVVYGILQACYDQENNVSQLFRHYTLVAIPCLSNSSQLQIDDIFFASMKLKLMRY